MGRLTDELAKLAGVDFFKIAKRESNPKTRIRFLAIGHLWSGKTKNEVAQMFQVSPTALRKWLLRYLNGAVFHGFLLDLNILNQIPKPKRTLKKIRRKSS